jgi:predicted acetyltransferase
LVTCRDDNEPSARVIEKCGGLRIGDSPILEPKRRRYTLSTAQTP